MTANDDGPAFFWFLPTHGDGRYLGSAQGGRLVDLAYLKQVAIAADSLGYEGVLIPTGASCEDSWLVAAALVPMTAREGAELTFPPVQPAGPPLYFGGSSADAVAVAGDMVDSYLSWGEKPADVGQKFAAVRARGDKAGRTLSYGVRLHVIVRETEAEAWREADRLIERLDDSAIAAARSILARLDSAASSA